MNQKNQHNFLKKQIKTNKFVHFISILATWLIVLIFVGLIIFIFIESIPGFKAYTISGIFFTDKFNTSNPANHEVSVWLPLLVTIIIAIGSIIIATPLALKTTTFIFFRVKNKNVKKILKITIEISAAIPSVIFGLFAYKSLGVAVKNIFNTELTNTVLTAIFMISLMIIPTIVLLSLNAYSSVENDLVINSMALGNSKTKSIYKIFRKKTRKQIIIAVIIAIGRVIGETMAVSMILSSENYNSVLNNSGFFGILTSSLRPLGAVISKGMFAENGGAEFRGLLFAFGIVMFIVVFLLNSFIIFATSEKNRDKFRNMNLILNKIGNWFFDINNSMFRLIKTNKKLTVENLDEQKQEFIHNWTQTNKYTKFYDVYKLWWECINTTIVFGAIGWIIMDVIVNGIIALNSPLSTVFMYTKDTTGQAFINTLLLIFITIIISFPISLFIAIGLNEYSKDGLMKKIILFLLDCIGATPSIIFGMFGLILFIETLHISYGGAMGNSLLAGALTMVILVLPTFTRMNQQALQNVPKQIKESGYSLGNSKWYVIKTLILPHAYQGLSSSIVLTIGRILAETAPLYITAGLSSANSIALLNPSQTLTTRIYAQLNGNDSSNSMNIMYESAIIALLLVSIIIFLSYLIIPNWKEFKKSIHEKIEIQKMLWKQRKNEINLEIYKTQIVNKTMYLTQEQADHIKVDENYLWKYKNEFITTKIIDEKSILKMQRKYLILNKIK